MRYVYDNPFMRGGFAKLEITLCSVVKEDFF